MYQYNICQNSSEFAYMSQYLPTFANICQTLIVNLVEFAKRLEIGNKTQYLFFWVWLIINILQKDRLWSGANVRKYRRSRNMLQVRCAVAKLASMKTRKSPPKFVARALRPECLDSSFPAQVRAAAWAGAEWQRRASRIGIEPIPN